MVKCGECSLPLLWYVGHAESQVKRDSLRIWRHGVWVRGDLGRSNYLQVFVCCPMAGALTCSLKLWRTGLGWTGTRCRRQILAQRKEELSTGQMVWHRNRLLHELENSSHWSAQMGWTTICLRPWKVPGWSSGTCSQFKLWQEGRLYCGLLGMIHACPSINFLEVEKIYMQESETR